MGQLASCLQHTCLHICAQIADPWPPSPPPHRFNSSDLNIAYKMPVAEYTKLCEYSEALEENWGKPPGNLNSNGQELLIYGKQYGNVFIGVQPTFGYEGDPMRLLFSRSASPHHGFAAYYTYLEKIFGADAVLHFGTHGSLEFMPGKQVGPVGWPPNTCCLLYLQHRA